jgi:hypothetical protein
MFEWEPNHAPQPDVIKTISIFVNRNSKYAEMVVEGEYFQKVKMRGINIPHPRMN